MRREGRVFYYFTENELKEYFQKSGFKVVEQWGGEISIGSKADTRKKEWIHFLLKKEDELSDLGEIRLLEKIRTLLPKITKDYIALGIGDDCVAIKPPKDEILVLTTDPLPKPVIALLGDEDPWYDGWFSMIISLSDLAAMGAKPLGILLAIEAKENMKLKDFERFYKGIVDASTSFKCPVLGGNIKDAAQFNCVSTAVGSVNAEKMLRRNAAQPGDLVVVLGEMGLFWAGVIHKLESIPLPEEESFLLMETLRKPIPKINEGLALVEHDLSCCAMDSSDGLIACFYEIVRSSNDIDMHIDLSNIIPHPLVSKIADISNIDVRKIMLSWGDWQLVTTVRPENIHKLLKIMDDLQSKVHIVGEILTSENTKTMSVLYKDSNHMGKLNYITNERFTNKSYYSYGLISYLNRLKNEPFIII